MRGPSASAVPAPSLRAIWRDYREIQYSCHRPETHQSSCHAKCCALCHQVLRVRGQRTSVRRLSRNFVFVACLARSGETTSTTQEEADLLRGKRQSDPRFLGPSLVAKPMPRIDLIHQRSSKSDPMDSGSTNAEAFQCLGYAA